MSLPEQPALHSHTLRAGMVGMGMIFDETYRPFFETVSRRPLFDPAFGVCQAPLTAVATRTGKRAEAYRNQTARGQAPESFAGDHAVAQLLKSDVQVVCIATPDDRHFAAAKAALLAR
nr:Gfo/Idh/MocA family oxidoreductase [Pirellulales bacterium]